jgi:hypothetical protein
MDDIYKIVYGKQAIYHSGKIYCIERLYSGKYNVNEIGNDSLLTNDEMEQFFHSIDLHYDLGAEFYRNTKRFTMVELYDLIIYQLTTILSN